MKVESPQKRKKKKKQYQNAGTTKMMHIYLESKRRENPETC
jgi:hypothetical protein